MKLTRFFSFFIPLYLILFSILSYIFVYKIVKNYEKSINQDYAIIVISRIPLMDKKDDLMEFFNLNSIQILENKKLLKNFQKEINEEAFNLLKKELPFFYKVTLKSFPTKTKLKKLKENFLKVDGVYRVETFSKNHDKVYSLLILSKSILIFVVGLILIFGIIIISNYVKIWALEESEKLEIILLLGGTIFYGAKSLIKTAFFSSLIAALFAVGSMILIIRNISQIFEPDLANLLLNYFEPFNYIEFGVVVAIGLFISIVTIVSVLTKLSK